MKALKKILIGIAALPFLLILLLILYEILGMIVNHSATALQTRRAERALRDSAAAVEITDVRSQTGNTSGTGNHVDCLTKITFTAPDITAVRSRLGEDYEWSEWYCHLDETDTPGEYCFTLLTAAPFRDNIEGH